MTTYNEILESLTTASHGEISTTAKRAAVNASTSGTGQKPKNMLSRTSSPRESYNPKMTICYV